jgi:regulatory protein
MMDDKEYKRLLNRAAGYCAKADHSTKEVREKLRRWAHEPLTDADIDRIVTRLEEERFLDEERYAHHFVSDKTTFLGKGPFMLRRELRMKGITDDLIEAELASIPDERWAELLAEYLAPKVERYRRKAKSPYDLRRRLMNAAFGRGYPSEIADRVISEMDLTLEGETEEDPFFPDEPDPIPWDD